MIESPGWVEWENDDITQRFCQAADNGHHVDTKADPPTTQTIQYMYQNNNSCSNHSLWWINNLPPKSYFISYKWTLPFYTEVYCFLFLSSAYGFYFKKCTSFLQNLIVLLFWYLAISEASVVKKINFVAFEIVDLDTNSCFNKILWSNQQFVKLSWKKILFFIPLSDCPQKAHIILINIQTREDQII